MVKVEKINDIEFARKWANPVANYKNTPAPLARSIERTARKELRLLHRKVPSRKVLMDMLYNMEIIRKVKYVGVFNKMKKEILYQVAVEKANERVLRLAMYNEREGSTRADRARAKTMRTELLKYSDAPMVSKKGGSKVSVSRHFSGTHFENFNRMSLEFLFPWEVSSVRV